MGRARRQTRARGQAATEYVILVGLVAILLIGVIQRYKDSLANVLLGSTDRVDKIAQGTGTGPGSGDPPKNSTGGLGGGGGGATGGGSGGGNLGTDPNKPRVFVNVPNPSGS